MTYIFGDWKKEDSSKEKNLLDVPKQMLNDIISSKLPGTASVFRSADELLNRQDLLRFNVEFCGSQLGYSQAFK